MPDPQHDSSQRPPFGWGHARRFVQLVVFLAFVALIVTPLGPDGRRLPRELFSQLDPLVGLATIVASRSLLPFVAAAVVTLALTVVFGRVWCGWFCPVGALLDVVPARSERKSRNLPSWLRLGKFLTLALVLGSAVFGTLAPMFLDPITIATRPLQELVMPWFGSDAVGRASGVYIGRAALGGVAVLSIVPLALVLGLNALARRAFCRMLCPLGGLLALVSKVPGVRRVVDREACASCAKCARSCPTAAIDRSNGFRSDPASCTVCMACVDECRFGATAFAPTRRSSTPPGFDVDRRETLSTLAATTVALGASAFLPATTAQAEILRPPATTDERLAELCVRCGACFSACPTGSLKPSLAVGSKAGLWTPMLEQRPAHCSLNCNRCAKVCPTDALHVPTPEEAAALGLGAVARVDRSRCLAWGRGRECFRCAPACPIQGALFDYTLRPGTQVSGANIHLPWVDPKLCVGCDQCARACPVARPAIGTHV